MVAEIFRETSCAQCTVRPNKPNHQSLEQRKANSRVEQGGRGSSFLKDPNSFMVFWGRVFNRQNLGRGRAAGCGSLWLLVI